jgi:uncharacterized protein YecE (DUF72 family)
MLRLIGRNDPSEVASYWESWSVQIALWIREGLEPWIFTHAPDDTYAPVLARTLHDMIRVHLATIPELPRLKPPTELKQMMLF